VPLSVVAALEILTSQFVVSQRVLRPRPKARTGYHKDSDITGIMSFARSVWSIQHSAKIIN